ncbi:MAG: SDR family oxidoreductase [Lentilitoribacter sp.]
MFGDRCNKWHRFSCCTVAGGDGAEVHLVCRNQSKGESIVADIIAETGNDRIRLLTGDLSSLSDVHQIAQSFLEQDRPLHVLLNNAGIFNMKRVLSAEGHEEMFAVNHLAHFLLTNLLLDRMKATKAARVVNVASGAHKLVKEINFEDLNFETGFRALKVYSHSKLANILFTIELARRLKGEDVTANAVDPGKVGTGLGSQNGWIGKMLQPLMKLTLQTPEHGAKTSTYACVSPELEGITGQYYRNCKVYAPKPWATDDVAAQQLWDVSAKLTLSA